MCEEILAPKDIGALRRLGMTGFKKVKELQESACADAPDVKGIYFIVRTAKSPPEYLSESTGGRKRSHGPHCRVERQMSGQANSIIHRQGWWQKQSYIEGTYRTVHAIRIGKICRPLGWAVYLAAKRFRGIIGRLENRS